MGKSVRIRKGKLGQATTVSHDTTTERFGVTVTIESDATEAWRRENHLFYHHDKR